MNGMLQGRHKTLCHADAGAGLQFQLDALNAHEKALHLELQALAAY